MSKMLKYGRTVGVTREETGLPYYKYFTQPMASVPPEKLALLDQGPLENGLPFEDRNMFLSGRDEELGYAQVGWGINRDGTGFVANTTYMPGVTGAMLDWWFPGTVWGVICGTRSGIPRIIILPGRTVWPMCAILGSP